jgi:MoaA/NifB/PqqE/SkfB family radical SAM enzyme
MEPNQQMEIQLGHMCNNRCVFCVSGQKTELREAGPLESDPILRRITEARAQGLRKLTLLGGEPTLQPGFMAVLRHAVSLGFEEIVLFTNGVKTAREAFLDEILATGGNYTFRLSFQGATRAAHEGTTLKEGSFDRLVASMRNIHARGKPLTVNMCVVRSNYESVAEFPALILPFGARQLHLDMIRPLDAGQRTEQELREMIPRYSDMIPHFEKMIAGFPEGFDVNIGNMPYCVAPQLARWIHHDGETTFTVSIDKASVVSEPWDKYHVKRRDKVKRATCQECVFDSQCSGVFETYKEFYGLDELVPVTRERLAEVDPALRLFTLHFQPVLDNLRRWTPPEPFAKPAVRVNSIDHEVGLTFASPAGAVEVAFRRPGGGVASTDRFSMHLVSAPDAGRFTLALLRELFARSCAALPVEVHHPVGDDAVWLGERPPALRGLGGLDPRLGTALRQLRGQAPFGALHWDDVNLASAGREAHLTLADDAGARVKVTLALKGTQLSGAYQLVAGGASPALADGVRALFGVLKSGARPTA